MSKEFTRKPIGNFFIIKELQIRLIMKIVFSVVIATITCLLILLAIYLLRYQSILLYQMDGITGKLTKEHIIFLLLPSLAVSAVVNILLAIGIGMYASRKYALPIYKLEQWAKLVQEGHLTATIQFREKAEFETLTSHCNSLTDALNKKFASINEQLLLMPVEQKKQPQIKAIEQIMSTIELESTPTISSRSSRRKPRRSSSSFRRVSQAIRCGSLNRRTGPSLPYKMPPQCTRSSYRRVSRPAAP
jgi:methyl-accepting chemotaxis protein